MFPVKTREKTGGHYPLTPPAWAEFWLKPSCGGLIIFI
ncbi:hypothetical protein BN134_3706 [Cronobacter dublinensis 1210]|uniref:Uncharacterized protein n=1 Tax=Cronobacter dublinensis 1210 TaxID=1208656 RepID=A0ABP1WES5_9ENTR|nr:hypothetical protein BN134_3706 [Cronobacter dublinensis 1210]